MEKIEALKYCSFHRCYNEAFTICFGVYAERNSDKIRSEQAGRRSDWPGKPFL